MESDEVSRATLRKISFRLIPFLFLLYVVAWLDRVNVGFAALQMNAELGFNPAVFGFGSGIFFIGYCLFEVPSNLVLARVGARTWIARIMITWGAISIATIWVRTPLSFYLLRFLLGVAEAGFFPGLIYYLSRWYPATHRARTIASFMTAVPVTGLIGGPASGWILKLDGVFSLRGWQWLFLLEGLPAIVLGCAVLLYLNENPETAQWLTNTQRDWLAKRLRQDAQNNSAAQHLEVRGALTNPAAWQLGIIFLLTAIGFFGYSFWAPLLIKSLLRTSDLGVGLTFAAISAVTLIAMLFNSAHSDRADERIFHIVFPLLLTSVGFFGCAFIRQPTLAILFLALVPIGHCSSYGPFWSIPARLASGPAAAAVIALVTSLAAFGGFIGPTFIGIMKKRTGTHVDAFLVLGVLAFAAALLSLALRVPLQVTGHRTRLPA